MTAHDHDHGPSRRKVLECMTWAGTGVLWTVAGGVPASLGLIDEALAAETEGLHLPADQRQPHGLRQARQPQRQRHAGRGDRPRQGAAGQARLHDPHRRHHASVEGVGVRRRREDHRAGQARRALRAGRARHHRSSEPGKLYRERYGRGAKGAGWYSFDANGVHFIGLVNVVDLKAGGLGNLGAEQLEWLEDDRQGPLGLAADRGVRAHPAVDGLSGAGAGAPRTARARSAT